MNECSILQELSLTSKDGKVIVPAVITLFQEYHEKLDNMFKSMKTDFVEIIKTVRVEVNELKSTVTTLQKRIVVLEDRIEENDLYERRDTLIFSGENMPVRESNENSAEVISELLKKQLNMTIGLNDISVSHRLSGKSASQRIDRSSIIAKFCRRDMKMEILTRARKKKPEKIFINECLTPTQQTISYVLRKAKKDFPALVSGSTTFDGKNYVWLKPPNPTARGAHDVRIQVSTHRRLIEFCTQTLKKPLSEYISEWKH